jgi:hypothetical protein
MTLTTTQAERDAWVDLQIRKLKAAAAVVAAPVGLETSVQPAVDTARAQVAALYAEKQVGKLARADYVKQMEPLRAAVVPLETQEAGIQARNAVKWAAASATKTATLEALKAEEAAIAKAAEAVKSA